MNDHSRRPILIALTSHWIAMAGVALVTLAGFAWLFLMPVHIRGNVSNPYIGLLIFFAVPMLFFAGLILIPIGVVLGRRRVQAHIESLDDRKAAWRRAGLFFASMTVINLIIGSQVSYKAVEHMETVQFCGQTCHVMNPEFTAHLREPHQAVACANCHVGSGASGWLKSKMAGTRQLMGVTTNNFHRPIESAMESDRLVASAETCEQCHSREKVIGPRLRVITKFNADEANTRTETVLTMLVGGGSMGGIHGAHLGPGVRIRYAAADKKRQTIPWVEYENSQTNVKRKYVAADSKDAALAVFEMQCVDCHNRAAHSFETPDRAIDSEIASGKIAASLPFVKKNGLALIQANYTSPDEARQKIEAGMTASYPSANSAQVRDAADALVAIYNRNVFPDLKVTWGTYVNNLGHADYPGCFRCHDDSHSTADKKTIPQDCGTCHQSVAMDEPSPEILKTLGFETPLKGTSQP